MLTGETGAGKSILVDALLLAAGGRAGAEVVRHGADRAEVTATFTIANNPAAHAWLAEQSIEHEDESVMLRRIVGATDARARTSTVRAMPVQALRQLGETLVDIHGQIEYQSLMRRAAQRELLDQSGDYRELLAAVAAQHGAWSSCANSAIALPRRRRIAKRGWNCCATTSDELKALDLKAGEIEELDRRATASVAARAAGVRRARDPAAAARSGRHECGARRVAGADGVALAGRSSIPAFAAIAQADRRKSR